MRVRFVTDFDWRPRAGVVVAYRAGMNMAVTRACAAAAIEAGAAVAAAPAKGRAGASADAARAGTEAAKEQDHG